MVKKTDRNKKDKGGRPPIFDSPEELEKKIQEYLGDQNEKPLTITGLCLYCGFESRQSFYDLEKRDGFSYTVKKARMRIENAYEKNLYSRNPAGSIFALKNLGWTDQQQFNYNISYSDISDAELIDRADKILNSGESDRTQ